MTDTNDVLKEAQDLESELNSGSLIDLIKDNSDLNEIVEYYPKKSDRQFVRNFIKENDIDNNPVLEAELKMLFMTNLQLKAIREENERFKKNLEDASVDTVASIVNSLSKIKTDILNDIKKVNTDGINLAEQVNVDLVNRVEDSIQRLNTAMLEYDKTVIACSNRTYHEMVTNVNAMMEVVKGEHELPEIKANMLISKMVKKVFIPTFEELSNKSIAKYHNRGIVKQMLIGAGSIFIGGTFMLMTYKYFLGFVG